jgi:hypothetical protein
VGHGRPSWLSGERAAAQRPIEPRADARGRCQSGPGSPSGSTRSPILAQADRLASDQPSRSQLIVTAMVDALGKWIVALFRVASSDRADGGRLPRWAFGVRVTEDRGGHVDPRSHRGFHDGLAPRPSPSIRRTGTGDPHHVGVSCCLESDLSSPQTPSPDPTRPAGSRARKARDPCNFGYEPSVGTIALSHRRHHCRR